MHPEIKEKIIGLAKATPDAEICGFIYADPENRPQILECQNIADDKSQDFQISDDDHIKALGLGRILGVYHSHPDTPGFSLCDLETAEHMAVPFYMYCVSDDSWHVYLPKTFEQDVIGRQFIEGFEDCYELVRIYFRNKGKYLADYDRSHTSDSKSLILKQFQLEGFEEITLNQIKYGDVLMFESDRVLSAHFGILVGPSRMIHHPQSGLSSETQLTDRWLSRITHVFRLKQG